MSIGRLVQMVLGPLMRKGIDHWGRGGKDPKDMTPEDRARHQKSREMQKRLRDMSRITRMLRR